MTEIQNIDGGQKDALVRRANIKKNFDFIGDQNACVHGQGSIQEY